MSSTFFVLQFLIFLLISQMKVLVKILFFALSHPFLNAFLINGRSNDGIHRTYAKSSNNGREASFATSISSTKRQPSMLTKEDTTWQAKFESLLDPSVSLAKRQILLSELLSANEEIRESVRSAIQEGKIDSLLTPTGRRLQEGTRAVARQIASDILPTILENPSFLPDIGLLPKVGSRVLNALSNQAKKTFDDLQNDIADPLRIPQRLSQQSQDLVQEAKNIFLETPEGLQGPEYTVVALSDGYEIRDYLGYTVASTTMGKVGEPFKMDDVASSGTAFNSLAAYLFGGNAEGKVLSMTTPVATTIGGEMRFYLQKDDDSVTFPAPLEQDAEAIFETGAVSLVDIPPTRLAVRKFTGFVTEGEISRQKDVLLQELELDGWEIDVNHGSIVPHIIFQYNPPYTIPVVRRNEIAVPIRVTEASNLVEEWKVSDGDDIPSDVE
jgi:SOUL heme-binding protein